MILRNSKSWYNTFSLPQLFSSHPHSLSRLLLSSFPFPFSSFTHSLSKSIGAGICAERTLLTKAISEGHKPGSFLALSVSSDLLGPCSKLDSLLFPSDLSRKLCHLLARWERRGENRTLVVSRSDRRILFPFSSVASLVRRFHLPSSTNPFLLSSSSLSSLSLSLNLIHTLSLSLSGCCGVCRQFIREFCSLDTPIFMVSSDWKPSTSSEDESTSGVTDGSEGLPKPIDKEEKGVTIRTLGQMLPMSFGPEDLGRDRS